MSRTHSSITIHLGDHQPPTCHTYPHSTTGPFASVELGGDAALIIRSADQAYALIGVLRDAARFLEGADPSDLRTTTEAEADFQAAQARAELARA